MFPCKSTILGYLHFGKPPYVLCTWKNTWYMETSHGAWKQSCTSWWLVYPIVHRFLTCFNHPAGDAGFRNHPNCLGLFWWHRFIGMIKLVDIINNRYSIKIVIPQIVGMMNLLLLWIAWKNESCQQHCQHGMVMEFLCALRYFEINHGMENQWRCWRETNSLITR